MDKALFNRLVTSMEQMNGLISSDGLPLQARERIRNFLNDLTDPDMYGFTRGLASDQEIRRRALELLELFK